MSNCINRQCRLCPNLVISDAVTVVTVDGVDTLVIDIPAGGCYCDNKRVCLVVAQTIPATATINQPVAISIGGGQQVSTANDNATQQLISSPIDGCFMTGIGDTTRNTAAIDYAAIVTPLSDAVTNATVANVVFVIEWDTVA